MVEDVKIFSVPKVVIVVLGAIIIIIIIIIIDLYSAVRS